MFSVHYETVVVQIRLWWVDLGPSEMRKTQRQRSVLIMRGVTMFSVHYETAVVQISPPQSIMGRHSLVN